MVLWGFTLNAQEEALYLRERRSRGLNDTIRDLFKNRHKVQSWTVWFKLDSQWCHVETLGILMEPWLYINCLIIPSRVKWMAIPIVPWTGLSEVKNDCGSGWHCSCPSIQTPAPTGTPWQTLHPSISVWKHECHETLSEFNNYLNLSLWRAFPTGYVSKDLYYKALLFLWCLEGNIYQTEEPVFFELPLRLYVKKPHSSIHTLSIQCVFFMGHIRISGS